MKHEDFRYMVRGKVIAPLEAREVHLLEPIEFNSTHHRRALLLLHGFSSSPAVYRLMMPRLKHYDTIVCPLLPGHGESIAAFSQATAEDWLSKASSACENLVETHQQVDVLGMSLGGLLACKLSNRFQLNHLYLLAPALALHLNVGLTLTIAKVLRALGISRIPNKAGDLCSNRHPELAYRQLSMNAIIQILTFIQNFRWTVPDCGIDLFLGRHDAVVDSDAVAKQLGRHKNVQLHWLNQSAHVLPLDTDVEQIIDSIEERNRC